MQCAVRIAGIAGRLLIACSLLFAVPLVAQDEDPFGGQPDAPATVPPATDTPAPETPAVDAPPAESAAAGDVVVSDEAESEPTSVDDLTAPVTLDDAPDWAQPYVELLDTDQNKVLSAKELTVWKNRGEQLMTLIEPQTLPAETFDGPRPIPEIIQGITDLDYQPNYVAPSQRLIAKANELIFRREIWGLEFSFRPLRMVELDIPSPSGRMERKMVWYMVYRVRYLGNDLKPEPATDEFGSVSYPSASQVSYSNRRFFPQFTFESFEYDKSYTDQVIPAAREAIAIRERPPGKLYNTVEMMNVPIPLGRPDSTGVWGYVTWTDLDPRIDYFSIYVSGLTNAFQIQDEEGAFKQGDPPLTGRGFTFKTLRLNFWRPGDSVDPHEEEIRFGMPSDPEGERLSEILTIYEMTERLDYLWEYR